MESVEGDELLIIYIGLIKERRVSERAGSSLFTALGPSLAYFRTFSISHHVAPLYLVVVCD